MGKCLCAPLPRSGHPFNITVYHVNERSYGAAPIDMNTADINGCDAGARSAPPDLHTLCTRLGALDLRNGGRACRRDMFFDLRSKPLAIECANYDPNNPGHLGFTCGNQEVNPPADDPLVVTKLVLTIAAPYGPYGKCNVCVNGTDNHGDYNCTNNACAIRCLAVFLSLCLSVFLSLCLSHSACVSQLRLQLRWVGVFHPKQNVPSKRRLRERQQPLRFARVPTRRGPIRVLVCEHCEESVYGN